MATDTFRALTKKTKLPQPLPYMWAPKANTKQHCFRFQDGKCKMAERKFLHQCEKCDSSQHGRYAVTLVRNWASARDISSPLLLHNS